MTRRQALIGLTAGSLAIRAAPVQEIDPEIVRRNDALVEQLLKEQNVDPQSRWRGARSDSNGLYGAGSAAQILESFSASFSCSQSRFFHDAALLQRMRMAAAFLERTQSPEGNISLLVTNFNSTPDTGFVVHSVATAAAVARLYGNNEIVQIVKPFLLKAGAAIAAGGIHTPNHRWVVSSALSQINELFPDQRYTNRINQWLAEGIDIDADGQFTERSMLTYNVVCDRAFVVLAAKLKRPELLDPARRNLHSLLFMLHADGEVVSEISRRQDVNTRGDTGRYWFVLRYLAIADGDGQFATLAQQIFQKNATLSAMLEYPELSRPLPPLKPLPDNFEKAFPSLGIVRYRRQQTSATIILNGNDRFFLFRRGDCVINAVRFETAFFGKGQFVPVRGEKSGSGYLLSQSLEAAYYQPVDHPVTSATWAAERAKRKQSPVCNLQQSAEIEETPRGFRLHIKSEGTPDVPLAVEINFREGGTLQGCTKSTVAPDTWILSQGQGVYTAGSDRIRFGPGVGEHMYTQMRGAAAKLSGPSVYLTGYTPFYHSVEFEYS
jgi:hypothetical protein